MQWVEGYKQFIPVPDLVLTDGTFDGVHTGHQAILKRIVALAKQKSGKSAVLTYWPHPRTVLKPEEPYLPQLSSLEEKAEKFAAIGIDYLIVIPFTPQFAQLSWKDFIYEVIVSHIQPQTLVVGYDHRFGKNREGNFENLKAEAQKLAIQVEEITKQEIDTVAVSSTKIRTALQHGDITTANSYLGHEYSFKAKVVKGQQLGRTIGFPTANCIPVFAQKLIPADGVYAVRCSIDGKSYKGMLNIGFRPTVNGTERTIEVHIIDFDADIYNKEIEIAFLRFIRPEQKFNDIHALRSQLLADKAMVEMIG
jgi:riboflavin kinase/FMN adenylyltransferase